MSKTAQNQINQIDIFSTLPDELLYLISEKLENVVDLVSLSSTNKRFNRICKDSKFNEKSHKEYDITSSKLLELDDDYYTFIAKEVGFDEDEIYELKGSNEDRRAIISYQKCEDALKFNKSLKLCLETRYSENMTFDLNKFIKHNVPVFMT